MWIIMEIANNSISDEEKDLYKEYKCIYKKVLGKRLCIIYSSIVVLTIVLFYVNSMPLKSIIDVFSILFVDFLIFLIIASQIYRPFIIDVTTLKIYLCKKYKLIETENFIKKTKKQKEKKITIYSTELMELKRIYSNCSDFVIKIIKNIEGKLGSTYEFIELEIPNEFKKKFIEHRELWHNSFMIYNKKENIIKLLSYAENLFKLLDLYEKENGFIVCNTDFSSMSEQDINGPITKNDRK